MKEVEEKTRGGATLRCSVRRDSLGRHALAQRGESVARGRCRASTRLSRYACASRKRQTFFKFDFS